MTNTQMLIALATAPRRAFEALAQKPRWLFPLLLVLVPTVLVAAWYYSKVDVTWLVDEQLRSNPRAASLSDAQRAQMLSRVSQGLVKWSSMIGIVIVLAVVRLLEATWYTLAGKVMNVDRSFRQWFALANWAGVPAVLGMIPAAIALSMTSGGQIDPGVIQPLSLNELFLHRHMGESSYQLASSVNLLGLIGLGLAMIGVKTWSGRSWLFAAVFVLLPVLLIFGTWALFALR